MAGETKQYLFSHKAIVEDMIRRQRLHEGLWMLTVELGLNGTNVQTQTAAGNVLTPAGVLTITRLGITRTKQANDLTVDAAKVNPQPSFQKSTKHRSKKAR